MWTLCFWCISIEQKCYSCFLFVVSFIYSFQFLSVNQIIVIRNAVSTVFFSVSHLATCGFDGFIGCYNTILSKNFNHTKFGSVYDGFRLRTNHMNKL